MKRDLIERLLERQDERIRLAEKHRYLVTVWAPVAKDSGALCETEVAGPRIGLRWRFDRE